VTDLPPDPDLDDLPAELRERSRRGEFSP